MDGVESRYTGSKDIFLLFGGVLVFLLLVSLFIPITYGINDDVTMRDIASGAISGSPDGHLIFVKYALGIVLASLYRFIPGVDWYGCVWLGFDCLCIALLLHQWQRYCEEKGVSFLRFAGLFLLAFAIVGLEHLTHFQFTIVAAVLAGTAVFLYYTVEGKTYGVIFLAWLAYCVRATVFWMAVPFAALVFLFREDSLRDKIRVLLIAISGIILISGVEYIAYSEKEWESYLEYNEYRSKVYDYYWIPSYEENMEFYHSIGMYEWDVANLSRYSVYLIEDIETEKMQQISDYAKVRWEQENTLGRRIKDGVKCAVRGFFDWENGFLNIFAHSVLLYNLVYEFRKRRKTFLLNLGFLGIEGVLWLYLGYQGRLPARVGGALLFLVLMSAWSVFYREQRQEEAGKWKTTWLRMILWVLLGGIAFGKCRIIQQKQEACYQENSMREELEDYFQDHRENVYFVPSYILSDFVENFSFFKGFSVSNGISLGGWSAFSPLRTKGLECYGILDVDKAIVEQDNIYLVLPDISTKIEEHYRQSYAVVSWEERGVIQIGDRVLSIFQICTEE